MEQTKLDKVLSAIVDGFEQFLKWGATILLTIGTIEQVVRAGISYPQVVLPILVGLMIVLAIYMAHVINKEML